MMLVYQLKVGMLLVGFYLLFKWLLSGDTFHRFNRAVLLGMVAVALVLPWVRVGVGEPSAMAQGVASLEDFFLTASAATSASPHGGTGAVALVYLIYYIGMVVVLLRNLLVTLRLVSVVHTSEKLRLDDGSTVVLKHGDVAPFSWLRWIVMSHADYASHRREILAHEQAHLRLGHSADVLLMDVLTVFQWWNPAAWLMKRELKQIHEFEADQAVLHSGVNARQYQLLLIRKAVGNQLFSMANNLNHNSLKRRIRMMTTPKSSQWQRAKVFAVVPLAIVAVVAFAHPRVEQVAEVIETSAAQLSVPADTVPSAQGVYDMVEQMPEFTGGMGALMTYLRDNLRYPTDAMKQGKEGHVIVSFVVDADGSVVEPHLVRPVFPSLDEEALRVVRQMPKWQPGRHKGQAVRVKYTIPITFKLQGGESGEQSKPEKGA